LRVVLDTNVLVSGLHSPFGPPGEIVRMVSSGALLLCLDARIFAEHDDMLARPSFGFDPDSVAALLDYIDFRSEMVASEPLEQRLPDPDDEPFLEVAATCGTNCLVTGDLADFPSDMRAGATVLSPAQFMDGLRAQNRAGDT
jgi:putative PIN family toxin of toxin-antitoxin system